MKHIQTLKANRRARILPVLEAFYDAEDRKATVKTVPTSSVDLLTIEKEGLIKRVAVAKVEGRRGRPATIYKLTDAGAKRVKRARSVR